MKKLIFMGVLGLFLLGSCNSKSGHDHEGHDHGTEEAHNRARIPYNEIVRQPCRRTF